MVPIAGARAFCLRRLSQGVSTMKMFVSLLALLGMSMSLTGCLLGAAVGAGAIAADEINEDDGKFDPFEEAYDHDPDTKGPIDALDDDDD